MHRFPFRLPPPPATVSRLVIAAVAIAAAAPSAPAIAGPATRQTPPRAATAAGSRPETTYQSVEVDGVRIFYREAGPKDAPHVLLLHGFPASSHMFRNLIPALADRFHVVAPDYPGFGHSAMPAPDAFDYSFDRLAEVVDAFTTRIGLDRYAMYVQDYGAPIGFRLAVRHPERVRALVIQNGNAYEEGLRDFWVPIKAYWKDPTGANRQALAQALELDATRWGYTHGARRPERISPDTWLTDQALLDRPGNKDIQLQLFYSYRTNPPLYPAWQAYFRRYQPPTLIVWGKNDAIFPVQGAEPYRRDLHDVEFHLLDTGHFALEEQGDTIARLMRAFLERRLSSARTLARRTP
jgi:pimeloyl-ACP methyl ester carboxylesterase